MKEKLLFNPLADDSNKMVFGGETSNTFNLYDIKYDWAYDSKKGLFSRLLANHWIPEKSGMSGDKASYKSLTETEQEAFLKILSFLIFLDSIQTNNLPNIAEYITAPEITLCLARQQFDEALHSRSYGYIMTSIFDRETALKAIYYWREDPILLERNKTIAEIYQNFKDNASEDVFIQVLVANFLLEGLYFYNGFMFFYNLASRGMMTDTCTQIKYINRDELLHCVLFQNIINEIKNERPELFERNVEAIYELFKKAVEQEIKFSSSIIGDKVLGMSNQSIHDYTHYLANRRLKQIGLEPIFEKTKDPYKHLHALAGIEDETSNKVNIFEGQSISYRGSSVLSGWGEI